MGVMRGRGPEGPLWRRARPAVPLPGPLPGIGSSLQSCTLCTAGDSVPSRKEINKAGMGKGNFKKSSDNKTDKIPVGRT